MVIEPLLTEGTPYEIRPALRNGNAAALAALANTTLTGKRSPKSNSPTASAWTTSGKSSIISSKSTRIVRRPRSSTAPSASAPRTSVSPTASGLLPFNFNHPIKVAEQAAVLDIISNGRMELGTGRSTTAQELDGFGVDYDRTRDGSARGPRHYRQGVDRRDPRIRRQADQDSAPARGAQADPEAASADMDGLYGRPTAIRWPVTAAWACSASTSIGSRCRSRWRRITTACGNRTDLVPKVPNENFAG